MLPSTTDGRRDGKWFYGPRQRISRSRRHAPHRIASVTEAFFLIQISLTKAHNVYSKINEKRTVLPHATLALKCWLLPFFFYRLTIYKYISIKRVIYYIIIVVVYN